MIDQVGAGHFRSHLFLPTLREPMFQPFQRTPESWGPLAHASEQQIKDLICGMRGLPTVQQLPKVGSKRFKAVQYETIEVKRTSQIIEFTARGQDDASNTARSFAFEPISSEVFDEVQAVLSKHGVKAQLRRSIGVTKAS